MGGEKLQRVPVPVMGGVWDDVKDISAKFKTADRDIPGIGFHIYYGYIYR